MVGIYKITNKKNGKIYIGQSNNCERRFKEHQQKGETSRIPLDIIIKQYGEDNFTYEVIEQCLVEELNEKEEYWIKYYDSVNKGYNVSYGGNQQSVGTNNGRAKLTEEDVIIIRESYKQHKKQKEVYELFKDKIAFSSFQSCWQGISWSHIMPEVFTEENKKYFTHHACQGSDASVAKLTDNEVIEARKRYVNEDAKTIYEDYKDKMKYQTFQAMLWGRSYKNLPVYKKKEKKWINL